MSSINVTKQPGH